MLNQVMRINLSAQDMPPVIIKRLEQARKKVQAMLQGSGAGHGTGGRPQKIFQQQLSDKQKRLPQKGALPKNTGKNFDALV